MDASSSSSSLARSVQCLFDSALLNESDARAPVVLECHVYEEDVFDSSSTETEDGRFIDVRIESQRFFDALQQVTRARSRQNNKITAPMVKKVCEYSYMDMQYTADADAGVDHGRAQVVKLTTLSSAVNDRMKLILHMTRREKMPFSAFPSVSNLHDKRFVSRVSFPVSTSAHPHGRATMIFEEYENRMGHIVHRIYLSIAVLPAAMTATTADHIARLVASALHSAGL